jgi:glycosyltransferase involved in cell wall biosynthesis
MTVQPLISVLMPVYNGEKYLGESIESILNQTFSNFELIIINDGSTDHTPQILQKYAAKDERIRLYNQSNSGVTASLNNALNYAKGEYFARMDHDDISYPNRFEVQIDFLNKNLDVGLVSTNCIHINSEGRKFNKAYYQDSLDSIQVKWELFWENPIIHPSVMGRIELIRSLGGYPIQYDHLEDYALWIQLAKSSKLFVLRQPLIYLRKHDYNTSKVGLDILINTTIELAQNTLVNEFNYSPSKRSICIIQNFWPHPPATSAEVEESISFISYAYGKFIDKYRLNDTQRIKIKASVARHLLRISLHSPDRKVGLSTFWRAATISRKLTLSTYGLKTLLKILLGYRNIQVVNIL